MIAAGIIIIVLSMIILIAGCLIDNMGKGHSLRAIWCFLGGALFMLGVELPLPPIKERKNEDFTVVTPNNCEIKKEIFINKDNVSDTTYYYNFTDGTVKDTE